MTHHPQHSVESAREAAERDQLDDWVEDFLSSPGSDNAPLGEELVRKRRWWSGPVLLPIDQLARLAGPADHPVVQPVDEDDWRDDVRDMASKIEGGWEPPPVVVTCRGDQYVLEDGNHRVEALRQAGRDEAWSVVGFDDVEARDGFLVEHLFAPGAG
jgi:hypothetical protein